MAKRKRKSTVSLPTTADDKEWQARCDARTLADALAIRKDPKRLSAASKAAKTMADQQMEEAKAMKRIAGKPAKTS